MLSRLLVCAVLACLILGGVAYVGDCPSAADADPGKKIIEKKILPCQARCAQTAHAIFERCMDAGGLEPNECSALARDYASSCRAKCRIRRK